MKEKVGKIVELLDKEYGRPRFDSYQKPLDELILTILSQNTTWLNCRRAFDNLRKCFVSWREVLNVPPKRLSQIIKCGGLGNMKARRIRAILKEIYKRKGALDLGFLKKMKDEEALDFLLSLEGVGPKTAACVLLFSCRKPVLPVDTHILRVKSRDRNYFFVKKCTKK